MGPRANQTVLLTLILVAFAVIVFLVSRGLFLPVDPDLSRRVETAPAAAPATPPTAPLAVAPSSNALSASSTIEERQRQMPTGNAAPEPSGPFLAGRVIDLVSGNPVLMFELEAWKVVATGRSRMLRETVANREGRFRFPLAAAGTYEIKVGSAGHLPEEASNVEVPEEGRGDILIRLDPGASVSGRVLDVETGLPIPGALVVPLRSDNQTNLTRRLVESWACFVHAETDDEGAFVLAGLADEDRVIVAADDDHVQASCRIDAAIEGDLEIRLSSTGFRVHGEARDDNGGAAQSIVITRAAPNNAMSWPVQTDGNGTYRMPPAPPGLVILNATAQWPRAGKRSIRFTDETKHGTIVDRDIEIDFGPTLDHVTWRGTLFGPEGEPLPTAGVSLAGVGEADRRVPRIHRHDSCDGKGRFEFSKLLPGVYTVSLRLANGSNLREWDRVAFESPGVIEQDLQITGGVLAGVVIDGLTGLPMQDPDGFVFVLLMSRPQTSVSSRLDEEARFRLIGLPEGSYTLTANVKGCPTKKIHAIELGEGEVIDDIEVVVERGGTLILSIRGFEDAADPRSFGLYMQRSGDRRYYYGNQALSADGMWQKDFDLAPGQWSTTLDFAGLTNLERGFLIDAGVTTEVTVARSEVQRFEGTVRLVGQLTYTDGAPVPYVRLGFYGYQVPGLDVSEASINTVTRADGHYAAAGFRPGRWWVRAHLDDGGEPVFPDLVIPASASDPHRLDLVLEDGVVSGSFVNSLTHEPFTQDEPQWWLFLNDSGTGEKVGELQGGHRGSTFRLTGIRAGEFDLIVRAYGYEERRLKSISMTAAEHLDLGEIELDPCGTLELEVLDEARQPVSAYRATCNGADLPSYSRETLEGDRFRHHWLPLGNVTITVSAPGFTTQQFAIDLLPGTPGAIQVILED